MNAKTLIIMSLSERFHRQDSFIKYKMMECLLLRAYTKVFKTQNFDSLSERFIIPAIQKLKMEFSPLRVLFILVSLFRLAESSESSCEYGQRVLSEVLMRSSDDMMKSVENICEERDTSISPDAQTFLNHVCKHIDVLRDEEVKEWIRTTPTHIVIGVAGGHGDVTEFSPCACATDPESIPSAIRDVISRERSSTATSSSFLELNRRIMTRTRRHQQRLLELAQARVRGACVTKRSETNPSTCEGCVFEHFYHDVQPRTWCVPSKKCSRSCTDTAQSLCPYGPEPYVNEHYPGKPQLGMTGQALARAIEKSMVLWTSRSPLVATLEKRRDPVEAKEEVKEEKDELKTTTRPDCKYDVIVGTHNFENGKTNIVPRSSTSLTEQLVLDITLPDKSLKLIEDSSSNDFGVTFELDLKDASGLCPVGTSVRVRKDVLCSDISQEEWTTTVYVPRHSETRGSARVHVEETLTVTGTSNCVVRNVQIGFPNRDVFLSNPIRREPYVRLERFRDGFHKCSVSRMKKLYESRSTFGLFREGILNGYANEHKRMSSKGDRQSLDSLVRFYREHGGNYPFLQSFDTGIHIVIQCKGNNGDDDWNNRMRKCKHGETMYVNEGNHRFHAAMQSGIPFLPVYVSYEAPLTEGYSRKWNVHRLCLDQ